MHNLLETRSLEEYIVKYGLSRGLFPEKSAVAKVKVFWFLYRQALSCSNHPERYYWKARIPKKTDVKRNIFIPKYAIKDHQITILKMLNEMPVSEYSYSYCKGRNIKQVAQIHYDAHKKILLKLDIEDFFGSIHYLDVYKVFRSETGASKALCTFCSNICCLYDSVPQGASTSPVLSNIVFRPLDEEIRQYAEEQGVVYTRYSDDLIFSFDDDVNPKDVIRFVRKLLRRHGFKLNEQKTKVTKPGGRYDVFGIVIGEKIQVGAKYRRSLRQAFYYITKFGLEEHMKRNPELSFDEMNEEDRLKSRLKYLQKLRGKIQYVLHINPSDNAMRKHLDEVDSMISEHNEEIERLKPMIIRAFEAIPDDDIPW